MSSLAHITTTQQPLRFGLTGALALHLGVAALVAAAAFLHPSRGRQWGENAASVGAIQASMVSAIPLPPKAPPVDHSVLSEEHVTKAPEPPPKEKAEPPPKPTDLLIKNKVETKVPPKVAPKPSVDPPKHPQPVPETPKAASGSSAVQLASSTSQLKNGIAATTIQNRAFGDRYAYYRDIVHRTVTQNWYMGEADPRQSQGKSVTLLFDIGRDGTVSNLRLETRSGSPSLDVSTMRAVQRVESFGPLPGTADHVTVEYKFDYRQP